MNNKEASFRKRIASLNLVSLLEHGSEILISKFNNDLPFETICLPSGKISSSAWDVSDISYYSILWAKESTSILCTDIDYVYLINDFLALDEEKTKRYIKDKSNLTDNLLLLFWGISRKQFWYQDKYRIKGEFNRQVEMLEILHDSKKIDIDYACKTETGFSIKNYRLLLFMLSGISSTNNGDMTTPNLGNEFEKTYPLFSSYNLKKVRDYITADYTTIRQSKYKEESFFIWPIIKTVYGKYITINQYQMLRKIAEGPLWAIKNHYLKIKSNEFVIYYGELLEKYITCLIENNVTQGNYQRIEKSNKEKLADWIVESDKFFLIIEQKAYSPKIELLERYPNQNEVLNYIKKYVKAFLQLDTTSKKFQSKKRKIKLILHYDSIDIPNGFIRDKVISEISTELYDKKDYYFIDVSSFTILIGLYKNNYQLFETIINEKTDDSVEKNREGYEFDQILKKYNVFNDKYSPILNHWENYFIRL